MGALRASGAHLAGLLGWMLSSPGLVRWGGVAAVATGGLGLAEGAVSLLVQVYNPYQVLYGLYDLPYFVAEPLKSFLTPAALLGVYALLADKGVTLRRLALSGAVLALATGIVPPAYIVREWVRYGDQVLWLGLLDSTVRAMFYLWFWGPPVAVILSGLAALRARGLGWARFVVLPVGAIGLPPTGLLLFRWYLNTNSVPGDESVWSQVVLELPTILTGAGWLLAGVMLYGALPRERRRLERERRRLEEENLSKARRLYERAFAGRDLSVVDGLLDPDFSDLVHKRSGARSFKRSIAGLHASFPDLEVSIEEQRACGETVETRVLFSGTDRGGVLWYPPTGARASFSAVFRDRFRSGRLLEHAGEVDMDALRHQLGLPQEDA